jgi:hypothetical protein
MNEQSSLGSKEQMQAMNLQNTEKKPEQSLELNLQDTQQKPIQPVQKITSSTENDPLLSNLGYGDNDEADNGCCGRKKRPHGM